MIRCDFSLLFLGHLQIILSDDDEKRHRNFQMVSISRKVRADGRARKVSSRNFDRDFTKKLHKGFFFLLKLPYRKRRIVSKVYILLQ